MSEEAVEFPPPATEEREKATNELEREMILALWDRLSEKGREIATEFHGVTVTVVSPGEQQIIEQLQFTNELLLHLLTKLSE